MRKSIKQKGFTLIELLLAVTLAIGAMGYVIAREFDKAQIAKAETQAGLLDKVNGAMGTYITNYYSQLVNNTPIAGVANIYAPTIAELKTLGVLDSTFSSANFYSGGYGTQAALVPTGCVAPNCDVSSLVWLTTPIRNANGQTDVSYAAFAAAELGADGAFSNTGTPGTLAGPSATWTVANPVGATAGIVAARNGYGSQGFAQFLRRDGSLPMTGSLNMGAGAITNLQSAVAGAACVTAGDLARGPSGEVLSCQSGAWNSQGSRFWRDPVANFASLPACAAGNAGETRVVMGYATAPKQRLFSCDGTSWGATAVDNNGQMTAGKYMVNDVVTEGTACTPNGLIAKDATGLLLSCQSGVWGRSGVGSNQSWAVVTASRSIGTTYTNTYGKPIEVAITTYSTCGSNNNMYLNVGGVMIGAQAIGNPGAISGFISSVVPVGTTYLLTTSCSAVIGVWAELR